jgi:hypothetical protein
VCFFKTCLLNGIVEKMLRQAGSTWDFDVVLSAKVLQLVQLGHAEGFSQHSLTGILEFPGNTQCMGRTSPSFMFKPPLQTLGELRFAYNHSLLFCQRAVHPTWCFA